MPLFPGKCCFPLSPDKNASARNMVTVKVASSDEEQTRKFPVSEADQLGVIVNVLGQPTEEDMSFVTDESAKAYISEFKGTRDNNSNISGMSGLSARLPFASDLALDLLKRMVEFNPYMRPDIDECLAHPFFEKIRRPIYES